MSDQSTIDYSLMPTDVRRIFSWPREMWSSQEQARIIEHRASLHTEARGLWEAAERENRNLTDEEKTRFVVLQDEVARLKSFIP